MSVYEFCLRPNTYSFSSSLALFSPSLFLLPLSFLCLPSFCLHLQIINCLYILSFPVLSYSSSIFFFLSSFLVLCYYSSLDYHSFLPALLPLPFGLFSVLISFSLLFFLFYFSSSVPFLALCLLYFLFFFSHFALCFYSSLFYFLPFSHLIKEHE